jgi:dihydrofolate synthase/folylpolyglutamate synthase
LARVSAIAQRLGLQLSSFGEYGAVIVGTNGKGSTAAMTAALLEKSGASVGLFTSPHLFDLNERFRIDGEDITDGELRRHWDRVAMAIGAYEAETNDQTGGFEFLFLIAADWFAARGCTHTVWEAGIGGRHDPVRLIEARRLALTSLDLEHTALLGNMLADIARDKLDAAPAGARAFTPQRILERDMITAHCAANGVHLDFVAPLNTAPLAGEFQRANAALALALARDLVALGDDEVNAGLSAVRWPGRLEVIEDEPLVVIDVGHTPAAVRAALEGFNAMRGERPALLVCGASRDKKYTDMLAVLAPAFDHIICAAARHKGAPAAEIAAGANSANPRAEITIAESVAEAHALALAKAGAAKASVYAAGGLFLAAEFKAVHCGRDPSTLAFF